MRIKARILQYGSIPPPGGEHRRRFLTERGTRSAQASFGAWMEAVVASRPFLDSSHLPFTPDPFARSLDADIRRRIRVWATIHRQLSDRSDGLDELPGEASARRALVHAVDAYHDLAGTNRAWSSHLRVHRVGEYVSGVYGCWHEDESGVWFEVCPVRLAHIPLGLSVGFTGTHLCSLCGLDISDCEHLPGTPYALEARNDNGVCSVCGEADCGHGEGELYAVYQHGVIAEATMHEVSLTPRPREPRARITAVELDPQPQPPSRSIRGLRCLSCLGPCRGSDESNEDDSEDEPPTRSSSSGPRTAPRRAAL